MQPDGTFNRIDDTAMMPVRRPGLSRSSLFSLVLLALTLSPCAADSTVIAQRLEAMIVVPSVDFEQTHQNAFFKEPQISRGSLHFDPATATLTKSVTEPKPLELTVTADQLSIVEDGKTRSIRTAETGFATQIFAALRALLLADADAIAQNFELKYSQQDEDAWALQLLPRATVLKKEVEAIDMKVVDNRIVSIRTAFNNGDWQLLRLLHAPPSNDQPADGDKGE